MEHLRLQIFFMKNIFQFHGKQKIIVAHRDAKFTSKFWKALFGGMGTYLNFNTYYRAQNDGHIERKNQILEDMLRMYAMDIPTKWEIFLQFVEFSYNNRYQASI